MATSPSTGSVAKKAVKSNGRTYRYWAASLLMGNGKRKTVTAPTKALAIDKLANLRAQRDAPPVRPRTTVGEFLRWWVTDGRPKVEPATWRQWQSHCRLHLIPAFGEIDITELAPRHIRAYLRGDHGLSQRTLSHHRSTLRRALSDAVQEGLVPANVAVGKQLAPKVPRSTAPILSADQVRILVDGTATDRLGALWTLIGTTGLRVSEALGLTWADVDLDEGTLSVRQTLHRIDGDWELRPPKTEKSIRTVPLAPITVAALRLHRVRQLEERLAQGYPGSDGLVFVTMRGRPIAKENVVAMLHRQTDRLGLPRVTVHSLRHSAATWLIASGYPIAKVAIILGHSSSRVTEQVYSHLIGSDVMDAAAVMERMVASQ